MPEESQRTQDVIWSDDRRWWWDGRSWYPSPYSPDGLWRWDGAAWQPVHPRPAGWRYLPSSWTRWLQLTAAAWLVIRIVYTLAVLPVSQSYARGALISSFAQAGLPTSFAASFQAFAVAAAGLGIAFDLLLLAGCLRLWRWVFWYQLVVYCLGGLGIPFDILGLVAAPTGLPYALPTWMYALTTLFATGDLALGIWMIVAVARHGTWARRRVPVYA